MRIDAHQHFWRYDPVRDAWITPDMSVIQRTFLPEDLQGHLTNANMDGTVAVQADQSEAETIFLHDLALSHGFIKGVVGWIDLQSPNLEKRLENFSSFTKLRGFRHVVQSEADGFLTSPSFVEGVRLLQRYGFTYDLLIYPHQLQEAIRFAHRLHDVPIVLDHLAKPYIKNAQVEPWASHIKELAAIPTVMCKASGMITEADWNTWRKEDFRPYLDTIFEAFGSSRIMFGSDWPVCLVAGSYQQVVELVEDCIGALSTQEKLNVMGANAMRFYNI